MAVTTAAQVYIPLALLHIRKDTAERTLNPTALPSILEDEACLEADILLLIKAENPAFLVAKMMDSSNQNHPSQR